MSTQPTDAPRGFVPMRDYLRLERELEDVREELAAARQQLRPLTAPDHAMLLRHRIPRLTPDQSRLLELVSRARSICSVDWLSETLEISTETGTSVKTQVWHINDRIRSAGGPGYTVRGQAKVGGYSLTPEGRAWLEANVPELFTKGAAR